MKKILCVILAVIMMLSIVGCGKKAPVVDNDTPVDAQNQSEAGTNTEGEQTTTADATAEPTGTEKTIKSPYTVQNEMIFSDDTWGTVELINITETKNELQFNFAARNAGDDAVFVYFEDAAINRTVMSGLLNGWDVIEIDPGAEETATRTIAKSDLNGLSLPIVELSFMISMYKMYVSDDGIEDPVVVAEDRVTIYPTGADPENFIVIPRDTEDDVMVYYDNDYLMTITGKSINENGSLAINCYLVNDGSADAKFLISNVTVNGVSCEPYWESTVAKNETKFDQIEIFQFELASIGVSAEEVNEISFTLTIKSDDWTVSNVVASFTGNI